MLRCRSLLCWRTGRAGRQLQLHTGWQLCDHASRSALQVTQPRSTNPKHMHVSGLLQGLDYSDELRERVLERHGGQEPLCSIAVGRRGF